MVYTFNCEDYFCAGGKATLVVEAETQRKAWYQARRKGWRRAHSSKWADRRRVCPDCAPHAAAGLK